MKVTNELDTYNGDERTLSVRNDITDRGMVILELGQGGHTHTVTVLGRELELAIQNALNAGR